MAKYRLLKDKNPKPTWVWYRNRIREINALQIEAMKVETLVLRTQCELLKMVLENIKKEEIVRRDLQEMIKWE